MILFFIKNRVAGQDIDGDTKITLRGVANHHAEDSYILSSFEVFLGSYRAHSPISIQKSSK